jgi:hypothetical protein
MRYVRDPQRTSVRNAFNGYLAAARGVEAAYRAAATPRQLKPLEAALTDAVVRLAAEVEAAARAMELEQTRQIFQDTADPPRLTGLDLSGGVDVIRRYLPPSGRDDPCFGILVVGGVAYGIHSGWKRENIPYGGRWYGAGLLRRVALDDLPGTNTRRAFNYLKTHVEPMVAGFLRKHGVTSATLYINKERPCGMYVKDPNKDVRCWQNLRFMLAPGTRLRVYGTAGPEDFEGVSQGGA